VEPSWVSSPRVAHSLLFFLPFSISLMCPSRPCLFSACYSPTQLTDWPSPLVSDEVISWKIELEFMLVTKEIFPHFDFGQDLTCWFWFIDKIVRTPCALRFGANIPINRSPWSSNFEELGRNHSSPPSLVVPMLDSILDHDDPTSGLRTSRHTCLSRL
jgi:hypothetical protein